MQHAEFEDSGEKQGKNYFSLNKQKTSKIDLNSLSQATKNIAGDVVLYV